MKMIFLFLILTIAGNIYSESQMKEIRYNELVEYELFDDHGVKGSSHFNPFKANTIFKWPDKIVTMSKSEKEEIKKLIHNDFSNIFNHYVEIIEMVDVEWSEGKVERYVRLYLQDDLMKYINEELKEGDYIDSYYWIFPPFSSFNQRINCFIVWYGKTK